MARLRTFLIVCIFGGTCWGEAPRLRPSFAAPLQTVWRAQVPTARSTDVPPWITLHVSPTQTRSVYELVQGEKRTLFAGPQAEKDADIQKRVLLMAGKQATVETQTIPIATLLVQTPGGRVEAWDAESGVRRWSVGVGTPGQGNFPAAMNDDYVAAISGSDLHVLDARTGKPVFDRVMTDAPGNGPVVLGTRAYVPCLRGLLKVYELADESKRSFPPAGMTSFGAMIAPPISTPEGIVWSTDRGSVFVSDTDRLASRYHIVGQAQIMGSAAYADATKSAPARLFIAYDNGYLLCAEAKTGNTLWGFLADAPIVDGPFVADDVVLVPTVENRLFAVDAETGNEVWTASGMTRAAAHAGDVVFGESFDRQLVLLDRKTGNRRATYRLAAGEHLVTNTISDRVYLASAKGSLRCLRLPQATWPTFHVPLQPTTAATMESSTEATEKGATQTTTSETSRAKAVEQQPQIEESLPAESAVEEDPFGSDDAFGEADDPFAAGSGEPQ